jgi:hypothetical protein
LLCLLVLKFNIVFKIFLLKLARVLGFVGAIVLIDCVVACTDFSNLYKLCSNKFIFFKGLLIVSKHFNKKIKKIGLKIVKKLILIG